MDIREYLSVCIFYCDSHHLLLPKGFGSSQQQSWTEIYLKIFEFVSAIVTRLKYLVRFKSRGTINRPNKWFLRWNVASTKISTLCEQFEKSRDFNKKKKNLTSLTTGFRHVAIGLKSGFLSEHLKYTQSGVGCWASKKEKEIIGERETGN